PQYPSTPGSPSNGWYGYRGQVTELKANANTPDVFQLERCLLPDQLALVPGLVVLRCVKNCHAQLLMKGWSGFSYTQKQGVMRPKAVILGMRRDR
ncbi:hypothetical protein, partial [Luteimonas notoginsengisoli]